MTETRRKAYTTELWLCVFGAAFTGVAVGVICQRFIAGWFVAWASFFWFIVFVGIGCAIDDLRKSLEERGNP